MTHYTYEPNHYKTLESGREVLLGPDEPLSPPFVGIASDGPAVRSPCRINGYGGTMFEPPPTRTIRGPCFDCDDALDDAWEKCPCHAKRGWKTAPTPKIDPEIRPNVPPRMMS